MGIPIVSGIIKVINTAGTIFGNWQQRKKIESQGKVDIAKARVEGQIEITKEKTTGEINYNVEAQRGMRFSWKDEYLVVVWTSILISAFLPWTQPYLKEGFLFLEDHTPWWYSYCLVGMVVASFGLKGWNFLRNGKGKLG